MVVKREWAIEVLETLPEQCSLPEILETLEVQHKILVGQQQIRNGKGISHEKAKERLEKWLPEKLSGPLSA